MKKLVLVGGGHAHVEVLRQFGLRRGENVELTLVSPDRHTPYSGMLPGLVAGHYRFEDCHIDLEPLARFAGARFLLTHAAALEPVQRRLVLADGTGIDYDAVSVDVGSVPAAHGIDGAARHATAVKPVRQFLAAWESWMAAVRDGSVRTLAMIGGGAAGVEMLLAMRHRLMQSQPRAAMRYLLVTDAPQLLAGHPRGVRAALAQRLARSAVEVRTATRIVRIGAQTLVAEDRTSLDADAVCLATGATAAIWPAASGLAVNEASFIRTNRHLQSISHPEVFAAGDCGTVEGRVYPKSGVYAVRQGPPLAENLRRFLQGASLTEYTPQPRTLALISTGEQHAIASYGPISFQGRWVWRWKDRIDRTFMARYRQPA